MSEVGEILRKASNSIENFKAKSKSLQPNSPEVTRAFEDLENVIIQDSKTLKKILDKRENFTIDAEIVQRVLERLDFLNSPEIVQKIQEMRSPKTAAFQQAIEAIQQFANRVAHKIDMSRGKRVEHVYFDEL